MGCDRRVVSSCDGRLDVKNKALSLPPPSSTRVRSTRAQSNRLNRILAPRCAQCTV